MAMEGVPSYSPAERERRWNLARSFMHSEGLDALLVYGEHEDAGPAAFDFDTWFTNDRPGSTIVFPKEGTPLGLVPYPLFLLDHMAAQRRGLDVWISAENIRIGRNADTLVTTLQDLKLDRSTIGVIGLEGSPPWYPEGVIPFQVWDATIKRCPDVTFKSVQKAFSILTMTLGKDDIAIVRHCAAIGEDMAKAMLGAARPGASETDVYAAGTFAALSHGVAVPWAHLYSDPEPAVSGIPHWTFRPQACRVLRNGDVIHSEIFAQFGMRTTQHQLTIAIGEVHKDTERAAAVAQTSYKAGLSCIRPGIRFGDVCRAMLKPVEETDGWVRGPHIHSLNPLYALCDFPGERFMTIPGMEQYSQVQVNNYSTPLADMQLQVGMSFPLEPSCGFGRHLVTLGSTIIVGEDGPIELNPFTAELKRVLV